MINTFINQVAGGKYLRRLDWPETNNHSRWGLVPSCELELWPRPR